MERTIEERYVEVRKILSDLWVLDGALSDDANCIEGFLDDLMAEREKLKEGRKDRYEFPVNEWNEQLVQTINDQGCPAKIVLTRRRQPKTRGD